MTQTIYVIYAWREDPSTGQTIGAREIVGYVPEGAENHLNDVIDGLMYDENTQSTLEPGYIERQFDYTLAVKL